MSADTLLMIAEYITAFGLLILLLAQGFEFVADVLERYVGISCKWYRKHLRDKAKSTYLPVLEELGLTSRIPTLYQTTGFLDNRNLIVIENHFKELIALCQRYRKDFDQPKEIGTVANTKIKHYISLMDARSDVNDMRLLSSTITDLIVHTQSNLSCSPPLVITRVAGLKEGNDQLASRVADLLGVPCVGVTSTTGRGPNQSDRVDGLINQGDSVIIVDDIALSGEHLVSCVQALIAQGATVCYCFCIIERTDRDEKPSAVLAQEGVKLIARLLTSDPQLAKPKRQYKEWH